MKKLIAALCLTALMLTGCSTTQSFLKPYSVTASDDSENVQSLISADVFTTFAQDLGVVSAEDSKNGVNMADNADIDAKEIFLTGTTDNQVLVASNIYTQMPPASITKILTALVFLKTNPDLSTVITLDDNVTVSVADAQVCGYAPGDQISLKDLFYSMLIYSGNDAANAIASYVGNGDISSFCDMMNEEAASLGATQTHFVTPNGLDDPDHYTSAYDLYIIFKECLKYDVFKDAISQSSYTADYTHNGEEVTNTWESTNYYLLGKKDVPEGITMYGGKTGTTDNAGLCLILYVEDKAGNGYISVMLGCPDKDTLYESMSELLSNIQN